MANLLDGLDKVYTKLVPELGAADMPVEHRATCLTCAMAPKPGANPDKPISFTDRARCCTYNPLLPNHVVGRILRRGDRGSEVMRARIQAGGGISALSVGPSAEWSERYRKEGGALFGRSAEITCPYWVDEAHGCTIWKDRNSVCRTWFCKHEAGGRGRGLWLDARDAIDAIDKAVAIYCVANGAPPAENARYGEWIAWYRWCAERVDLFDATDLAQVRTPYVLENMTKLELASAPQGPLPDVVVPNLLEWFKLDGMMWATAYSAYDMEVLPADLFAFLSQLDGVRSWRDALGGEPGLDEALVRRMWQRGMLVPPETGFRAGSSAVTFRSGTWGAAPELQEQIATALSASLAGKAEP
jgi:hypothetical protein